jgi:hypothetical protein
MKRIVMVLSVVVLIMVMVAIAVGPVFATQPTEFNPPQHPGASRNSDNCVAFFSAQVIHNGADVRTQTPRGGLVKEQQATCNNASPK